VLDVGGGLVQRAAPKLPGQVARLSGDLVARAIEPAILALDLVASRIALEHSGEGERVLVITAGPTDERLKWTGLLRGGADAVEQCAELLDSGEELIGSQADSRQVCLVRCLTRRLELREDGGRGE
jgi:hypothetical protein